MLPEFIPFNDSSTGEQDKIIIPTAPNYHRNQQQQHSDRNPDRNRPSGSSTDHQRNEHSNDNGNHNRRRSRDSNSYRSPRRSKERQTSPTYSHRSRNRSRSPQASRNSRHDEQNYQRDGYQRSPDRQQRHGSVFERMSSPKPRRYGEPSSRRSEESSHANGQTQFIRTIAHPGRNHDDALRSFDKSNELVVYQGREVARTYEVNDLAQNSQVIRYQDDQRHDGQSRRAGDFPAGSRSPIQYPATSPRMIAVDEQVIVEMRNLRERLITAETHCLGLQTTVRAYEREILKLRHNVNTLIDDFEYITARLR